MEIWQERVFRIGPYDLQILQDDRAGRREERITSHPNHSGGSRREDLKSERLSNVGARVWEAGLLLAQHLVLHPPFQEWAGVNVLDLGTGTGIIGIALAKAGAKVTYADLPHIVSLAEMNIELNDVRSRSQEVLCRPWGPNWQSMKEQPEVVTGGDLLYDVQHHAALLETLQSVCAPHTLVYLSLRHRGLDEDRFHALIQSGGFHVGAVDMRSTADDNWDCSAEWDHHGDLAAPYQIWRIQRLP